jgi:hypothetical protein
MTRSATEVMQDIVYAAVVDGIVALKAASKGLPNTLLRDLNAIHANTTLADLPPDLQASIQTSVRATFTRLLKEGYSVSPGAPTPPRPQAPRGERIPPRGERPGRPVGDRPQRRDGPPRPGAPRGGSRPPRKPTS